ncbi:MAG: tryptophan--tRNA ligase [Halobacteriovoraceae bacterium]|nr:tryptophan--tRNA ligase [Halobacteriovoraceae bacterium]
MGSTILSGMRPTGPLHIGHYVGVIKNWVELQKDNDCFFFVADWHALTSNYDNLSVIREARRTYVRGWIAAGVDPEKCHIYNQSDFFEILKLNQFFLTMTPPGWADRSPSWKDLKMNPQKKLDNLGFYTYPILQATDIAIVKGQKVPVGEDQVTHIEIGREIIRKFNRLYNTDIPEPEALLTKVPKLLGIDGSKMSSSKGNTISLQETEKSLQKKINKMKTDDLRGGVENPGNPENCSVFDYHKIFNNTKNCSEINDACRSAGLSCGECKQKLGLAMKSELMPIAQKMSSISDGDCDEIIAEGNKKVSGKISRHWDELSSKIMFK